MSRENLSQSFAGRPAADNGGNRVGTVEDVYLDPRSGEPEFALVSNGLRPGEGTQQTIVPLVGAHDHGEMLLLGFDRGQIAGAPLFDGEAELTPDAEEAIYAHYQVNRPSMGEPATQAMPAAPPPPPPPPPPPSPEFSSPPPPMAAPAPPVDGPGVVGAVEPQPATDEAMTRSEEELVIGKQEVPRERVRLRKHVVTEEVQVTVTLRREELRIEREPIHPGSVELDPTAEIGEAEMDFFLLAEQPVVTKQVVPVERVRVTKDVVTEEELVADEVRKERIDLERDPQI